MSSYTNQSTAIVEPQDDHGQARWLTIHREGRCPDMGWTIDQTSHRLLCDALRETVHAGPGALDSPGSIRYWASAVLYMLLLDHPVDQRGRCRSCRRSGAMIGLRRRSCRVHAKASYWLLRQPDDTLLSHLANEVGEDSVLSRGAATPPDRSNLTVTARIDPSNTGVLPKIMDDPRTDPAQTPAVPFPLSPREFREVGRPEPHHSGTGKHFTDGPPSRRVSPDDQPRSRSGGSLVVTRGVPWLR